MTKESLVANLNSRAPSSPPSHVLTDVALMAAEENVDYF